jgi:glycosyltransferase involved in cell wall biosynthesis
MEYSIIVPAYNEGTHLETYLTRFVDRLPLEVREVLIEVLIVENGSTDHTLAAALRLQANYPRLVRVISLEQRGYGEGIKRGIHECRGTHFSILECDFLDMDFVVSSLNLFRNRCSRFIVGSKRHPESSDQRPLKRRVLTICLTTLLKLLFGYPGSDTRGLKSMKTELGRYLCALSTTRDEVLQTELVLLAWRLGLEITELPVSLRETRPARFSLLRRLPKGLGLLLQLRRSMRGFHKRHQSMGVQPIQS